MPIHEYQAKETDKGCAFCRRPFEQFERLSQAPLTACPQCGLPVARLISAPAVGASRSGFDARAKAAGFTKLKKLGHGEYEKQY
jgi:putative FmdB family regulatory protein